MDENNSESKSFAEENIIHSETEESVNEEKTEQEQQPETTGSFNEGEYHFVRPEQKLYEDAGFVPRDEDAAMPKYYVPAEKKPKEKKVHKDRSKFLKVACLCLVCALLGGLAGAFIFNAIQPDSTEVGTASQSGSATGGIVYAAASDGNAIYELGCKQSVGITTEVTTTNWFGQTSSSAVSGSGFVISEDGYIMTNYHVIEYAYEYNYAVSVMFSDGTTYDAVIAGVEEDNDIAVLKIDAEGLSPVEFGDSDSIIVGEPVYAIGNPLGELAFTMTTGYVSALNRSITTSESSGAINMFQFDAAVNSGNSGGPLYNAEGQVIGIVTAKYQDSGVEGLGFAIPINDAVEIANDLMTKGYVSGKAYMGVSIDSRYTSVYAEYYDMPEGAYVFSVTSGSCAEKCGLCAGDIITKLGDTEITSYEDLTSALRQYKAGDSAEITVYHSNDYETLTITFDEAQPTTDSSSSSNSSDMPQSGMDSAPQMGNGF